MVLEIEILLNHCLTVCKEACDFRYYNHRNLKAFHIPRHYGVVYNFTRKDFTTLDSYHSSSPFNLCCNNRSVKRRNVAFTLQSSVPGMCQSPPLWLPCYINTAAGPVFFHAVLSRWKWITSLIIQLIHLSLLVYFCGCIVSDSIKDSKGFTNKIEDSN